MGIAISMEVFMALPMAGSVALWAFHIPRFVIHSSSCSIVMWTASLRCGNSSEDTQSGLIQRTSTTMVPTTGRTQPIPLAPALKTQRRVMITLVTHSSLGGASAAPWSRGLASTHKLLPPELLQSLRRFDRGLHRRTSRCIRTPETIPWFFLFAMIRPRHYHQAL